MGKWQARALAATIAAVWLFGLMFVEGLLVMSAAHASSSAQRLVLALVAVVGLIGVAVGGILVTIVWRSGRQHS
jgi:heme/copper-type cytochrome/quinol oxidase subunit 2